MLPYSLEVLLSVVARINSEHAVWVAVAWLLGLGVVAASSHPAVVGGIGARNVARATAAVLAGAWVLCGFLFFGTHLAPLFFGAGWLQWLYVAQGVVLLAVVLLRPLEGRRRLGFPGALGVLLMIHALIAIPLLDMLLGTGWPAVRVVGWAPEPTIVFTAGWLLTRVPGPFQAAVGVLPACAGAFTVYQAYALDWPPDAIVPLLALLPIVIGLGAGRSRRA